MSQQLVRNLWDDFEIISGGGTLDDRGVCVMQAVAYVAGETDEHTSTDHPQCASEHLTEAFIGMNDTFSPEQRQQLRPFIPRLVGTRMHNTMNAKEKALFDYAKVDYAKLLYDRLAAEIDEKIQKIKDAQGDFYAPYVEDFRHGKGAWHESTLAYAVNAYIQLLSIEQEQSQIVRTNYNGQKVYDGMDTAKVDISALLEHINQTLPEAKPYTVFNGSKVNVMERIHKMVNFWRQKKGIQTEWPHEEGIVVDAA